MKRISRKYNSLFLSILPLSSLGLLSNARTITNSHKTRSKNTHTNSYPLLLPVIPKTITTRQEDINELTNAFNESKNETNALFSFPNKKHYKLTPQKWRIHDYMYYGCRYKNWENKLCTGEPSTYEDQLITLKPRVYINSLKNSDNTKDQYVKYKPDNLNYDDWTSAVILDWQKNKYTWRHNNWHRVNWKEQYGYYKKNVFENTHLLFNNKDKKSFTSEKYSLHVDRSTNYGKAIPIFSAFSKMRDQLWGMLGFEEYDEVNIPYNQLLSRNKTTTPPNDYLAENKHIDISTHTKEGYGWYNPHFWGKYNSYQDSKRYVEKMSTGKENNWGSPYLSWWGMQWPEYIDMHTLIPLSDTNDPFELTPMDKDDNNSPISGWGNDLYHVNYDHIVMFDQPVYSSDHKKIYYPFSLNLNKIKQLSPDLKNFFKISENFNFYLNWTYDSYLYRSNPYSIQDLINEKQLVVNINSSDQNHKISDVFLSIEPIDKERVQLINPGYDNWYFSVYGKPSVYYDLNRANSLNTINLDHNSNIQVNENILKSMLPSQLNYYQYLSQLFSVTNQPDKKISSEDIRYILQPIVQPDDNRGTLTFSYYDPNKKKTITKYYNTMMALDTHVVNKNPNITSNKHKSVRHSSISFLTNSEYSPIPDYLLSNSYWNKNVKIIPLKPDYLDTDYKIKVTGFDNLPVIKKQWQDRLENKVFKQNSSFPTQPIQLQRYTLKKPDEYVKNPLSVWDELIHMSPIGHELNLDKNDYTVNVQKDGDSGLNVNVTLMGDDQSWSKNYSFSYDQSKIVNGQIDDPSNPFSYQPPNIDLTPRVFNYSHKVNSHLISDNVKWVIIALFTLSSLILFGYLIFKGYKRSLPSTSCDSLV